MDDGADDGVDGLGGTVNRTTLRKVRPNKTGCWAKNSVRRSLFALSCDRGTRYKPRAIYLNFLGGTNGQVFLVILHLKSFVAEEILDTVRAALFGCIFLKHQNVAFGRVFSHGNHGR